MHTLYQTIIVGVVSLLAASAPSLALAADVTTGGDATGTQTPTYTATELPFDPNTADKGQTSVTSVTLGSNDPFTVTYRIINAALTFLGLAFLIVLIYAGTLWAMARGNEEQIDKAKNLIRRSVMGLIIILAAYGIAFVMYLILLYITYGDDVSSIGGFGGF